MEFNIDTTLSAISSRLENLTCQTFTGFIAAVSEIPSKMHLKTMLERQASESSFVPHRAAITGDTPTASVLPSVLPSFKQAGTAWQDKLEISSDSTLSSTSSCEKLQSVSWRQVIDEENIHGHTMVHTESGTMPAVMTIEYVRELEKQVFELETSVKQLRRGKNFSQNLVLDKTSDVSKANAQLEEALKMLQSKDDEADDLCQTLNCLRKRIKTLEATMETKQVKAHQDEVRQAKEKIFQAEQKARQAEERACQAEKQLRHAHEEAHQAEEEEPYLDEDCQQAEEEESYWDEDRLQAEEEESYWDEDRLQAEEEDRLQAEEEESHWDEDEEARLQAEEDESHWDDD